MYAEWSTNEKVALEVVLGASMTGRRAITAMKHVGLNVAADSLMTMGLVGAKAGLVIAVSDDIGFSSSQNEQDSRFWGRFVHLPVFEPADAAEAYAMTREAFALSERHQVPVLLRLTTRVSHVKRTLPTSAREAPDAARHGYQRDAARWIITPNHVGKRLELRAARDAALAEESAASPWNVLEPGTDRRVGFVVSGAGVSRRARGVSAGAGAQAGLLASVAGGACASTGRDRGPRRRGRGKSNRSWKAN